MLQHLLSNQYVVGLGVPIFLLFTGAFTKKLVRATAWEKSDFFLGVEFTLAAMTSALIYFCENAKEASLTSDKLLATAAFLAITFGCFLFVLATHQQWEKPNVNKKSQFIQLGIISNLVGFTLICAFIFMIKGF